MTLWDGRMDSSDEKHNTACIYSVSRQLITITQNTHRVSVVQSSGTQFWLGSPMGHSPWKDLRRWKWFVTDSWSRKEGKGTLLAISYFIFHLCRRRSNPKCKVCYGSDIDGRRALRSLATRVGEQVFLGSLIWWMMMGWKHRLYGWQKLVAKRDHWSMVAPSRDWFVNGGLDVVSIADTLDSDQNRLGGQLPRGWRSSYLTSLEVIKHVWHGPKVSSRKKMMTYNYKTSFK